MGKNKKGKQKKYAPGHDDWKKWARNKKKQWRDDGGPGSAIQDKWKGGAANTKATGAPGAYTAQNSLDGARMLHRVSCG